jgi:hypothetical protein
MRSRVLYPRRGQPALNPPPRSAGFSVVEGLIAAGLLLMIAVGVLPMFGQAIKNNFRGERTTEATNFTRSSVERFMRLPFGGVDLTLPGGSTEAVDIQYWGSTGGPYAWSSSTAGEITWTRTTRLRQYTLLKLSDYDPLEVLEFPGPETTGAPMSNDPEHVFLKQLEVQIASGKPSAPSSLLIGSASVSSQLTKVF